MQLRRTFRLALFLCLAATAAAQSTEPTKPPPSFEVATIKPGTPGESAGIRILVGFTQVETLNTSVADLIKYAYNVHPNQILGGPNDLMHRGYAIKATITAEKPNADTLKAMLRALLAERFNLTVHNESRELPVYLLTAETTPHLKPTQQEFAMATGGYFNGQLSVHHGTPTDLAAYLQRFVTDRPVLDRTGITGHFDMELNFTPDDAPPTDNQTNPNLYTAIREQLGLKLTAAKAPTNVLVIDSVTAPTAN